MRSSARRDSRPRRCGASRRTSPAGPEELRAEEEVIRHWDEVEREWTVILKGIAAANLKRKHHLGTALLKIYKTLSFTVGGSDRLLRPYFDAMKEAYLKGRKKPAKAKAPDAEPGTPAE